MQPLQCTCGKDESKCFNPCRDKELLGEDVHEVNKLTVIANESYADFTNALQKGMDFVQNHTPEEIAAVIAPQFPETDLNTITTIVTRYYDQKTWKEDLIFEKDSFELLQDILESAGELDSRTPYESLVTTEFAKEALKK
mgnify:CR=1 FL=1